MIPPYHPPPQRSQRQRLQQERTAEDARLRSKMAVAACAAAVYAPYNTPSAVFPAAAAATAAAAPPAARDVASVSAEQVQAIRRELEAAVHEGAARVDRIARTAARLADSGRQAHASAADANSQFDSVARLVAYVALLEHPLSRQAPASAATLRGRVTGWLQAHRAALSAGLNRQNGLAAAPGHDSADVTMLSVHEYHRWCHGFSHTRWGDQYSLQALAEVLDLDIYVWSTRGALYDLCVTPGHRRPTAGGGGGGARKRAPIELLELPGGVYCPVVDTRVTHLE